MNDTRNEATILADVYENVRSLTKFYIHLSREIDSFKRTEVNGNLLNSRYWLIAHLVWTEHHLIVKGIGNKDMNIPWLTKFEKGSEPSEDDLPSLEEVLSQFDVVHAAAVEAIRSTTDEDLSQPNHLGFGFRNGDDSKRMLIHHAIRHEPCHVGQIGWLCKINGIETV